MIGFLAGAAAVCVIWFLIRLNAGDRGRWSRPTLSEAIGLTDGFNLTPVTARYAERHQVTLDQAAVIEREFRRFFALATASKRPIGIRSEPVDAYWHETILFTRLYERLCREVVGRYFHHDPTGGSEARYARTWAAYTAAFDTEPNPAIWPRPDAEVLRHFTDVLERERSHHAFLASMQPDTAPERAAGNGQHARLSVEGLPRFARARMAGVADEKPRLIVMLPAGLAIAATILATSHPAEADEIHSSSGGSGGCGSGDGSAGDGGGCGGGCGGGGGD